MQPNALLIWQKNIYDCKKKWCYTEASFAQLTLEGEGDAFRFHLEHKTLTANRMKAI
jgi:hypothetical protein